MNATAELTAYWITPEGVSRLVGTGLQPTHSRWIWARESLTVEEAEELGWHRIVVEGGTVYTYGRVEMTVPQNATVERLRETHGAVNINRWARPLPARI